MKQTAVDWMFARLWETPKDKFTWNSILEEAKPSDYQSYFMKPPIKEGKCEYYWGKNAESVWDQLKEITK